MDQDVNKIALVEMHVGLVRVSSKETYLVHKNLPP